MEPKYPHVEVQLVGQDGNAFAIMGRVTQALRDHGVSREETTNYAEEAMSGSYDDLIRITGEWVTIY